MIRGHEAALSATQEAGFSSLTVIRDGFLVRLITRRSPALFARRVLGTFAPLSTARASRLDFFFPLTFFFFVTAIAIDCLSPPPGLEVGRGELTGHPQEKQSYKQQGRNASAIWGLMA